MYLAYDPGKTTGWAAFRDNGEVFAYGQVSLEELIDHLNEVQEWSKTDPIKVIIYEDFIVYKSKAQKLTGSRMEASQAIGMIKKLASDTGAKLVQQPANIKSIAQKWTQLRPRGSHDKSHWIDAFNHGAFYLINKGIRQTELERSLKNL